MVMPAEVALQGIAVFALVFAIGSFVLLCVENETLLDCMRHLLPTMFVCLLLMALTGLGIIK